MVAILPASQGITQDDLDTAVAAAVLKAVVDAKGDLIVATAADTVANLSVGATKGHGLKVNSATTPGVEWGPVIVPRRYKSGWYYQTNQGPPADLTMTPTKDRVTYHAFPVYADISVDRLSLGVSAAGTSGAKVRLGIYADDGAGFPGALVLDAGTINGDSNTYQEIAISPAQALVQNTLYWIAVVWQVQSVASGALRASGIGAGSEWVGTSTNSGDARVCSYIETGVTGALAAAGSVAALATGVTQPPSVKVRIV